ncbi:MAG: ABC transporter ATP-binding protein [Phycisphaerae bacterium]|nr:ABC transporter ATP-binding protein [Phycisphaerae bacterium]
MSTAISIRGIRKAFPAPGGGSTLALHGVDLEIAPGELFFLLGPSGCGKTTLLRIIAGFIEPTGGSLLFNGRDVTDLPPNRRNTGMVFQSYALWPHMTVEGNVAFGLQVRGLERNEQARRVREALAAVRMDAYAKRRPNQLSGGQQQRVALARALVVRPDVLLLDEPLSNLDARLRIELRGEIRRICKSSGITTVYVTHDQKEALSMADRIAVMEMGRLVQSGTPAGLYRAPASRFVAEFLGETNFIEGRVEGIDGGSTTIATPAGTVIASADCGAAPGSRVLLSIRPESIRLGGGEPGALSAEIAESVYLGEIAQHTLRLGGGVTVKAAELNPTGAGSGRVGSRVPVSFARSDVVVLPLAEGSAHGADGDVPLTR